MKQLLSTPNAPKAIGPYSQGVKGSGSLVFVSGQLPIDPATNSFPSNDIADLTRQCILNVQAVLRAGGCELCDVVKTTVFLADLNDFAQMNAVYAEYFNSGLPARAAVQVARLPKDAKIEIEAIALCKE